MTQRELASKTGLSVGAVRDLEQGRTRFPQPASLAALAGALGLSLEQIRSSEGPRSETSLLVQVLGPLAAWRGSAAVPLGGGARRAVLGLLALSAGSLVHREALIDALWPGDPPRNSVSLVQAHVSRLRRMLDPARPAAGHRGGGFLVAAGPGYRLQAAPEQLDLLMLGRLSADARAACSRGDVEAGCRLFERALELWRGDPLADVDLLRGHVEVVRLSWLRAELVTEYARVASGAGWHGRVLGALRELAAREPLNEQAHAQLMIALAGCGQQAEALAVYHELCGRLDEELGMPPGPDLAAAQQRVLRQEVPLARAEQAPVTIAAAASQGPAAEGVPGGRVVPRQLPVAPELFVGREAQLSALDGLLDVTAGTVVISAVGGTAGVGKTALALHWAHGAAARFPDGQLYVNLRGYDPSSAPVGPAEALEWFLDALGVAGEGRPASVEARAGLYRSLVAGRRLLIVLDNARDAEQVRPLLPGSAGCVVLVTSRAKLSALAVAEGARLLSLDVLTEAEAGQMLAGRMGTARVRAEPGPLAELIGLCARLPLALAIIAVRGAARPEMALAEVAAELADTGSRLDALEGGDAAASLRAVMSWSYLQLTPAAARMFRLLGLHPGPDIGVPAAASLAGVTLAEARQELAELTAVSLLNEQRRGRFAFHDLLRDYAAEQARATDSDTDRGQAIGRVLDHYLHVAARATRLLNPAQEAVVLTPPRPGAAAGQPADRRQALAWFEQEHRVLLAAIALAAESGFDSHAWQLPWAMSPFLRARGHWQEWAATQRTALATATRLGDTAAQALSGRLLANACINLGDHDQALGHYASSLTLCQQRGNLVGQAKIHQSLSVLADRQGRYADSLGHAEQALRLYQACGDQANEAEALNNVGWYNGLLGDYHQARSFCRQALTLSAEVGDRWIEGNAWDSAGYAEHHLGNLAEAAACYQHALSLFRESGARFDEADTLTHLGDTHHAARNLPQARDAWQQALGILDELHHPDAEQVRAKLRA
jgi:DNA-binding SARP family transcriptional activator/tetratricopeptide (TPR) repeat protein